MSSAFRRAVVAFAALAGLVAEPSVARELRVCADPNNMPFSDRQGGGFENKIVELIADELHAKVSYVWWAQRRGFLRSTLNAGLCDLVPGTQTNMEMLRTTRPYYRSGYVFVTREREHLALASLDDPRLEELTIGVQLIGDDGANTPPVQALARRGIVGKLRGFPIYGDYATADPGSPIIKAVADGAIDVAIAWGPLAGYYASREATPLEIVPVEPRIDGPQLPLIFDISMGVRKEDTNLLSEINAALAKRRPEVDANLAAFHVPRLDVGAEARKEQPR